MYYADQPFHTKYHANAGDTVAAMATRRGFPNAGPLVAYPPNQALFSSKYGSNYLNLSREFSLAPGDVVYLPWREDSLRNLVTAFEMLIKNINNDSEKMIAGLMKSKEELEHTLTMLDILSVASGATVATFGAAAAYRSAELVGTEAWYAKDIFKNKIGDFILGRYLNVGGVAAVATDAPSAKSRSYDWVRLLVRHTLNVPSPSYWVGFIMAVQQGDYDLWWSGPDHVVENKLREIARRAKLEIQDYQKGVFAAKRQLALPFYQHRI
ncbi:hypothetical protein [Rhodanobacter sp. L36]|uniref:hypothetical protein n=1 Tax=Rhodanobacter sp. L36 TaxID=1747221 RepID=UPI00131B1AFA|nr:hypothetical protein [Rhodanobacter sp. L36]